jgi:phosphatidylethanolamine/phosphatidyl-N-methylethanolamine N-methyltransferase
VLEHALQPVANRLGWRSEFPWQRFSNWIDSTPHGMRLIERRPMPPLGHFSLIRFGKNAASTTIGQLAAAASG